MLIVRLWTFATSPAFLFFAVPAFSGLDILDRNLELRSAQNDTSESARKIFPAAYAQISQQRLSGNPYNQSTFFVELKP